MLFSIAIGLMVILVAAFWVYQGLFSSAFFFFQAVIASCVAFGFFESVNSLWAASLDPGLGLPLAFVILFLGVLIALRFATDKYIQGNVKLPVVVDRAGGGAFGLLTGLVLVGTALTAAQMLPVGGSIFGFDRLQATESGAPVRKGFLLKPDSFAVALFEVVSGGAFAGENSFAESKPDFLLDLYSARATVQSEDRIFLPADAVKLGAWWETRQIDTVTQRAQGPELVREFTTQDGPGRLIVCSVRVSPQAAPQGKSDILFRVPQFRLVGPPPKADGPKSSPIVITACGLSDLYTHYQHGLKEVSRRQSRRLVRFNPRTDFVLSGFQTKNITARDGSFQFEVAFEVPEDFTPWYLEFKRGARVELTKAAFKDPPPAGGARAFGSGPISPSAAPEPKPTAAAEPKKPAVKVGAPLGGATHIANAVLERTGVYRELPFPLRSSESAVARALRGKKVQDCHFFVEVPAGKDDPEADVKEFFVPEDKTLVQVGSEKVFPGSLLGRALGTAANVVGQVKITDDQGDDFYAIGIYASAPVGGKPFLEIQYHPEADMPERCLQNLKKVTPNVLQSAPPAQRKLGYLFLVERGRKIVRFSAGKAGSSQELIIDVP